ncbi:unnamed protein product, partial [Heterotrigona itama]
HLSIDISIKDGDTIKFNPFATQKFNRNQLSLLGTSSFVLFYEYSLKPR